MRTILRDMPELPPCEFACGSDEFACAGTPELVEIWHGDNPQGDEIRTYEIRCIECRTHGPVKYVAIGATVEAASIAWREKQESQRMDRESKAKMSDEKGPLERDHSALASIKWLINGLPEHERDRGGKILARLRSSIASWAHVVVELTHEKYTAEAEIDRLRADLEKLRGEGKS